jgi:hypothetical protein
MVAELPSPEESVQQSKQADFLSDHDHPINELLDNISWLRDDATSTKTEDDDELLMEMELLSSAEREISQELSRFSDSYIKQQMPPNSKIAPIKRRRRRWRTSKVNGKKEKAHANISNIHEIDTQMIERDTRDSPDRSYPSDEVYNGIDDNIFERDPPAEELPYFEDVGEDDYSNNKARDLVLHRNATRVREGIYKSESAEGNSLHYQERDNDEEEESAVLSEWELNPNQLSDLEKGENNIFEEEKFWDDGLWKSPLNNKSASRNTYVQSFERREQVEMPERRSKIPPISDTRSELIEMLSLPTLEDRRNGNDNADETEKHSNMIYHQCLESRLEKAVQRSVVGMSAKSNFQENNKSEHTERTHTQSTRMTMTIHDTNEDEDDISMSTHRQYDISNGKQPDSNTIISNEESHHKRNYCWCNLRILVVTVHILLITIGIIVFCQFLLRNDSQIQQQSYTYEIPFNDDCSVVLNNIGLQSSNSTITYGTTFGATGENNPCNTSMDHVGVWYTVTGTGGHMVVSTQSESEIDIHASILFGECDDLMCISSSENPKVTWLSVAGESYRILVHGQSSSAGNFSLSLFEATLMYSDCEAAPSLISSSYTGGLSIVGTTEILTTDNNVPVCSDSLPEIGSITWYSIKGSGSFLSASICDYSDSLNEEISLQLFTGRCDDLTCFPMNAGLGFAAIGTEKEAKWLSVPEEMYYIAIWSSKKETTQFNLCLDRSESGSSCHSVVPISASKGNYEIIGSIGGAGRSTKIDTKYCGEEPPPTPSRWYTFTGTGSRMTATTCYGVSNNFTALFGVFTGTTCDALECIYSGKSRIDSGRSRECGTNGQQFLSWNTIVDQKYWIAVHGEKTSDNGNFTLNLLVS